MREFGVGPTGRGDEPKHPGSIGNSGGKGIRSENILNRKPTIDPQTPGTEVIKPLSGLVHAPNELLPQSQLGTPLSRIHIPDAPVVTGVRDGITKSPQQEEITALDKEMTRYLAQSVVATAKTANILDDTVNLVVGEQMPKQKRKQAIRSVLDITKELGYAPSDSMKKALIDMVNPEHFDRRHLLTKERVELLILEGRIDGGVEKFDEAKRLIDGGNFGEDPKKQYQVQSDLRKDLASHCISIGNLGLALDLVDDMDPTLAKEEIPEEMKLNGNNTRYELMKDILEKEKETPDYKPGVVTPTMKRLYSDSMAFPPAGFINVPGDPRNALLGSLSERLMQAGDFPAAEIIIGKMSLVEDKLALYAQLAKEYAKTGKTDALQSIESVVESMVKDSDFGSDKKTNHVDIMQAGIAMGYMEAGKVADAIFTAEFIIDPKAVAEVYKTYFTLLEWASKDTTEQVFQDTTALPISNQVDVITHATKSVVGQKGEDATKVSADLLTKVEDLDRQVRGDLKLEREKRHEILIRLAEAQMQLTGGEKTTLYEAVDRELHGLFITNDASQSFMRMHFEKGEDKKAFEVMGNIPKSEWASVAIPVLPEDPKILQAAHTKILITGMHSDFTIKSLMSLARKQQAGSIDSSKVLEDIMEILENPRRIIVNKIGMRLELARLFAAQGIKPEAIVVMDEDMRSTLSQTKVPDIDAALERFTPAE